MSQVTNDKKKMQQKSHLPYKSPCLHFYGSLRDLTAGGSGATTEAEAKNMSKNYRN